jgi:hypothetical protein
MISSNRQEGGLVGTSCHTSTGHGTTPSLPERGAGLPSRISAQAALHALDGGLQLGLEGAVTREAIADLTHERVGPLLVPP